MRSTILTAGLLLASACTYHAMSQTTLPTPGPGESALVTTTGEGKVRVKPDEVTFSIDVTSEAEDLARAKQDNGALTGKAIAYLEAQGVEARDIQTQYLSVNVEYRNPNRIDPRYVASQTIEVRLRDVERYEAISLGLLQEGITGLRGPQFGSSRREELAADARTAAVLDARQRARAMAKALGQDIGAAYRIDDTSPQGGAFPLYQRTASFANDASAGGPGVAAGELEVTEQVTVSFYLR